MLPTRGPFPKPSRRVCSGNSLGRTACPYPAGSAVRHPPAPRSIAPSAHAAYPDGRIAPSGLSPALPTHPPGPATCRLMRRGRSAIPARALVDLLQRHTLVLAVIPLDQAGSITALSPRPASSQVSLLHCIGLQRTSSTAISTLRSLLSLTAAFTHSGRESIQAPEVCL